MRRTISLDGPLDLVRTMRALDVRAAGRSPSSHAEARRATRAPTGPAAVEIRLRDGEVTAEAWGSGAEWVLDRLPALLGLHDDPARFTPPSGLVDRLHRAAPGLRLGRTEAVFETLLPTILGQKVTGKAAKASYRGIVARFGEPAPGPLGLHVPPGPDVVAELGYEDLHPLGVERKRAAVIVEAARRVRRLEEIVTMEPDAARARLTAIRGIGPWTAAIVEGVALGDPDAVPVGDYHLPNLVSYALAGEPRGDDDRMLELLEPYRGHRRRALLLLKGSGIHAPRYGPRLPVRSFERS